MALAAYNLGYTTPFVLVPVMVLVTGAKAGPILSRLNRVILSFTTRLTPLLLILLGAWLVFDAVYYFIVGKPVFLIGVLDLWGSEMISVANWQYFS